MIWRRSTGLALATVLSLLATACSGGATQSPAGSQGGSPGASGPAGSGGSPSAPASVAPMEASGTLNVMGFGCREGDDIAKNRVAVFEEAFPDVELSCVEGGFDDQQFLTAVQSGNPPDLIYMDRTKVGTFASQGAIQPLDDCISKAGIDMANFREAEVTQVTFDGQPYGIPEFFNVAVIVINNAVAEEADVNPEDLDMSDWDALKDANTKMLKKDGSNITRLGFDPKLPEFLPLWAKINGVEILSADGKTSNLDDPKVAEALTAARDLILAHGTSAEFFAAREALSPDFFGAGNPIAGGVLGAFPIEVFFLNVMAGNSPDVDITVVAPKTKDGQDVTLVSGLTWAIPEGAKNPDAACAMAATMTHEDTFVAAAEARKKLRDEAGQPFTGTYTGNKRADERIFGEIVDLTDLPQFDEAVKTAISVSDSAYAVPATGASVEFEAAWREAVRRVLDEGTDPAEALADADKTAQDALDAGGG